MPTDSPEPRVTLLRAADGSERVLLDLADFQALLDAANASKHGLPELAPVVARLRAVLEQGDRDALDLERFLAGYDAVHRQG
jgi:hypothetical protein